ncbi:MAG: RNA-directed DNA polymerase [Planctomycetota bacterium]
MHIRASFLRGVRSIGQNGDTDIFPSPLDKYLFFDNPEACADCLHEYFNEACKVGSSGLKSFFRPFLSKDTVLSHAGFKGFRWATQIHQFGNAYLLGLVIHAADRIQVRRDAVAGGRSFSYNFRSGESSSLFTPNGWQSFESAKREIARQRPGYVGIADIADFYSRVYHHRIKNEMNHAGVDGQIVLQIDVMLSMIADDKSFGLPIGGDASRILAELALVPVDEQLVTDGIEYRRYVDDYVIFGPTRADVFRSVVRLSEILHSHGLSLQKSKLRIDNVSSLFGATDLKSELDAESRVSLETDLSLEIRRMMLLDISYDPYSETAKEDYDRLKEEAETIRVGDILSHQIKLPHPNMSILRRIFRLFKFIDFDQQAALVEMMLDNSHLIFPILPRVLHVAKPMVSKIDPVKRGRLFRKLRAIVTARREDMAVPMNRLFALRLLAHDPSTEATKLIAEMYRDTNHPSLRRDAVLVMARRGNWSWLGERRKLFDQLHQWEQEAFIACSFLLGDEGAHWRRGYSKGFSGFQMLTLDWMQARVQDGKRLLPV